MAMKDKIGHGSLGESKNRTSENSPAMIGSLTFEQGIQPGEKVYIAAWWKQGQQGDQYISISVERPDASRAGGGNGYRRAPAPRSQYGGNRAPQGGGYGNPQQGFGNRAPGPQQQFNPRPQPGGNFGPQQGGFAGRNDMDDEIPF